jgi:O-acetyl-ADP-ribose deacetylase (regulator of RNase III)
MEREKESVNAGSARKSVAETLVQACTVKLVKGDITREQVDALVNAANTSLSGGGGVDGAIHQAGGPEIMEACDEIRNKRGGIATGEAVLTTAGKLPAAYVIHTAGPVWHDGKSGENRLLAKCYRNSLHLACKHNLKSIAFPNISTGVYGFPKQKAAEIAVKVIMNFVKKQNTCLQEIRFVCFDDENHRIYQKLIPDEQLIRND